MRRSILAVALATVAFGGVAAADDAASGVAETASYGPGKAEGGVFVGGFINNFYHQFYDPDLEGAGEHPLDRVSPMMGIRGALFPHRMVGVELEGSVVGANRKDNGDGVRIFGGTAQLILQKPGRLTPFISLGATFQYSDSETLGQDHDIPLHAGGGIRYWLSESVAFRFDARYLRGPSYPHPDKTLNASYGEFMVGLSFRGKPAAAPAVVVEKSVDPDPDKDGVSGMADECPTENGGSNPDGCPTRHTGGARIAEHLEKCKAERENVNRFADPDRGPGTPPGARAQG